MKSRVRLLAVALGVPILLLAFGEYLQLITRLRPSEREREPKSSAPFDCYTSPSRILIAHEQHLQEVGSDRRLLALISSLRMLGTEVSLIFRTSKGAPPSRRRPSTRQLAKLLGAASSSAILLDESRPPPRLPAILEYGGTSSLTALVEAAEFDLVLCTLWFWYDPQPSFAELVVPVVRAYGRSRAGGVPQVAMLCDDAHATRAMRLAAEEPVKPRAAEYLKQSSNLHARSIGIFSQVDAVFYLTLSDLMDEAATHMLSTSGRTSELHVGLLRMSVRMRSGRSRRGGASHRSRRPAAAPWVGFVGDGRTATNYLGLQRFLREGWPLVRKAHPSARLRVVGRVPSGHRAGSRERRNKTLSAHVSCASDDVHCGWAWGTACAGREAACGVDVLGYLSEAQLEEEAARWKGLLAPIFASTGVNTKLLLGLQLGLPIVTTEAAAVPFELVHNETAVLGNTPAELAAAVGWLFDVFGSELERMAGSARAQLRLLAESTAADDDLEDMLFDWLCVRRAAPTASRAIAAGRVRPRLAPHPLARARGGDSGASGSWSKPCMRAGSVGVASMCGLEALWPDAHRITELWRRVCHKCGIRCVSTDERGGKRWSKVLREAHNRSSASATQPPPFLLLDAGCVLHPSALSSSSRPGGGGDWWAAGRSPAGFVHFAWDPAAVRDLYHMRGGLLPSIVKSERLAAAARSADPAGTTVRIDRMRGATGYSNGWRLALGAVGIDGASAAALVRSVVGPQGKAFTGALRRHVARPVWPKAASPPPPPRAKPKRKRLRPPGAHTKAETARLGLDSSSNMSSKQLSGLARSRQEELDDFVEYMLSETGS